MDEEADEIFYKLGVSIYHASSGNSVCQRQQSKGFLECMEVNLLTQLLKEPTRGGASLGLLFVNREGLVWWLEALLGMRFMR